MQDLTNDATQDVVICGGGLAGLLLARQLRQELPDLSVTVLEKTRRPLPDACHKVGESSVEVASQHLERLGLSDYLKERHIFKLGLRFFPGGGRLPLEQRTEIGPSAEPIVHSYQLDRGRFEGDLRGMLEDDGVRLVEGARVTAAELGKGEEPHVVTYAQDGDAHRIASRWLVDATGRAALLRSQLKLKRGTKHEASAGWFRIAGRFDINSLVPASETAWHNRPCADQRWRSTNHFMGDGYWVWVIPLSTGLTSIGVVVHEDTHDFHEVSSLDRCRDFLARHEPVLGRALETAEVKDFLCLRKYNNMIARSWSPDRWGIVGEAGAFVDPLYSPGSDFITFANCFTTELIRMDQAGEDIAQQVLRYNGQYRAFVSSTTELFRTAAPIYGHPQAMTAKIYWDNFTYWSYTGQYYKQQVWKWLPEEHRPFDDIGRQFVEYSTCMNAVLRAWAELAPATIEPIMRAIPAFPSILVEAHIAAGQSMSRPEALAYVQKRIGQAREIVSELVLRIVQELGPERGQVLLDRAHYTEWNFSIPPERLDLEALHSRTRRRKLPDIARDIERNLGGVKRHEAADAARSLLAQGSAA
ncbi:MAG: NAD(P)/FAD-dependent oxidoreductase [Planctomycetota bacterium]|jgi:flavin-dependent dehydrogenase